MQGLQIEKLVGIVLVIAGIMDMVVMSFILRSKFEGKSLETAGSPSASNPYKMIQLALNIMGAASIIAGVLFLTGWIKIR